MARNLLASSQQSFLNRSLLKGDVRKKGGFLTNSVVCVELPHYFIRYQISPKGKCKGSW